MTTPVVTLVNGTGFQYGVASDELGINIEQFRSSIKPQFVESLPNKINITRCDAYGPMELELSISGEISGTTGVMASVLGTAFVPVNTSAYWGAPTTGLYFQGGEITEMRSGWKKVDTTYKAKPGIP